MTKHEEEAKQLFLKGHACSQAVLGAYAKELGLDEQTALKMSLPFGGGIGRLRETCGAVSGMLMALGLKYGQADAAPEHKAQMYARVQELVRRFKEENGSIICRELLGLSKPEGSPSPSPRTPEYYKVRPCVEKVGCAARLLEEYLKEQEGKQADN